MNDMLFVQFVPPGKTVKYDRNFPETKADSIMLANMVDKTVVYLETRM